MQILYMGDGVELRVKRGYSGANGITIFHLESGEYVYGNGKPVERKDHLAHLPSPDKKEACEWFDLHWGRKPKEKEQ